MPVRPAFATSSMTFTAPSTDCSGHTPMPNSRFGSSEQKSVIQRLYARAFSTATSGSLMSPEISMSDGNISAASRPSSSITDKRAAGS